MQALGVLRKKNYLHFYTGSKLRNYCSACKTKRRNSGGCCHKTFYRPDAVPSLNESERITEQIF